MTHTQMTIIGKVSNGRMTTLAATEGRVIGKVRTIKATHITLLPTPAYVPSPLHIRLREQASMPVPPTPTHTVEVVHSRIDSPFISMVQANSIRVREEKVARIEAITIENKRNKRIQVIKSVLQHITLGGK